ncbi:MAG: glucoamylase family protein [Gemmatimonadales bacterium]
MNIALPFTTRRRDAVEPPIRADLFGIERLEQHAESLAAAQGVIKGVASGRSLLSRVDDNARVLRESNRAIAAALKADKWITPAAEWLVDNFYVTAEQLRQIRSDLSVGFYRGLPKLADGPFAGYPRVYGVAWAFVAHTDSRMDPEMLRRFVLAYQRVQPLTIGELWAVPIVLRVVLIENLRRLSDAMSSSRAAQQQAQQLAEALLSPEESDEAALALKRMTADRRRLSPSFVVELLQRLRNYDPGLTPGLAFLQRRLAAQGTTPAEITLQEHQREAATTVTVRNVITSMRLIAALDWTEFFESVSLVDRALRASSDYAAMDFASRDDYRHAIEALARGSERPELEVAQAALQHAEAAHGDSADPADGSEARIRDAGYYLIGRGRIAFEQSIGFRPSLRLRLGRRFINAATLGFFGTLLLFTALVLAGPIALDAMAGLSPTGLLVLGLLALIPASDLAVALLNREITTVVTPRLLPRFEWPAGVPADCRTMVVVPTLLTGLDDVEEQVERLEVHFLGNADGDVRFALLSDWSDAPTEHRPDDEPILAAALAGVAALNKRHGPAVGGGARFFVFHRARQWNESEGVWMGWERKRGKLHELNRLLRGAVDTSFFALPEGVEVPTGVRYVLTLDSDTRLPGGSVRRLVGTMAHPLNRPRLDPVTRCVVEGYGVLQPRVTPTLPGRAGSLFQRMSSVSAGIDPYSAAVSDVYQDLFGEGSYTGKGIYDVDAFEAALAGRVPENALLSHDLFEGLFARAGLVTDIELFEAAPSNYLTATGRQHRWARGDWQLLPWILRHPFSKVGRWKMLDNLRRTLSMPLAFLTLLAAWGWPASRPDVWTGFILAVLAIPTFLPVFGGLLPRVPGISKRMHLRAVGRDIRSAVAQFAFTVTMIAHQAWVMTDAIVRTLVRLYITGRHLLEWKAMATVAPRTPVTRPAFHRAMAGGLVLAAVAAVAVATHPAAWLVATPVIALWALAPSIAFAVSRPIPSSRTAALPPEDVRLLRRIARRTWSYFTTFVTPESRALPPDNFQEDPDPVIAERTSPTNVGLYLLTAVSARDFGWIGTLDLADRLEATLRTVAGLEKFRGHLFNWYDTSNGQPLEPRYVSSVDSGNLAGALLTLSQACWEILDQPILLHAGMEGVEDAADLLREAVLASARGGANDAANRERMLEALDVVVRLAAQRPATPTEWAARLAELDAASTSAASLARDAGSKATEPSASTLHSGAEALRRAVETLARDLDGLMPWARLRPPPALAPIMATLGTPMTLRELPKRCEGVVHDLVARQTQVPEGGEPAAAQRAADALLGTLERSAAAGSALAQRLARLAEEARRLVTEMEFGFLFDPVRMLFSIGYRMSDGSLDSGRYDLLASEARLLSFVAIAKGEVPVKHWFRLGRPLAPVGKNAVLLSWSGSMFEYLMPRLLMRAPPESLLDQTATLMLQRQIAYGAERGVPWGVSESGYFARDLGMTFQYSNFGVPGLGLRRGLADDLVIAPYATGLATMIDPIAAARNFRALLDAGAGGRYGFVEALDYTPARLPADTTKGVVTMYMAHHQGMLIVAIGNLLHHGGMRTRFHTEPMVQASELLLQERMPRDVAVVRPQVAPAAALGDIRELVPPNTRHFTTPHGATPRVHLLSNGRYAVMLTAAGSGFSRWHDLAITRWREDVTSDDTGAYFYLRDVNSGERWSAGYQPSGEEPDSYDVSFAEDRAEFVRRDGTLETRLEVIVSSEDDAEVRRVSITNHAARAREIEVTSYAEVVLAPPAADAGHPAFSNLFVQTECVPERNTLLATRRPRAPEDPTVWLAHVLAVEGETVGKVEWETDRRQFLGRGRGVHAPLVEWEASPLSDTTGPVLDPIVSLRRRVRLPPGKTVRLVFSTLVDATREGVLELAEKYNDVTIFERAATMAWTRAMVQLHHLGIGPDEAQLFQSVASALLYVDRASRAPSEVIARQCEGVGALWTHGISGDLPIVLVQIDEADDVGIVRQLLRAHEYWRMKGLAVDLVILNDRAPSYVQDLQTLLDTLVRVASTMPRKDGQEALGRVYTLRADHVTPGQRDVLESVARVFLSSQDGTLAAQVARVLLPDASAMIPPPRLTEAPAVEADGVIDETALEYFNGLGGFDKDGREYRTVLRPGRWTPAPWVNVLANAEFGCLVSEAGAGCSWSVNSQANRITPWANDPVSDPPSEMFYIRDEESGDVWSPTPLPMREPGSAFDVRHGRGFTRFACEAHDVKMELVHFVPQHDPLKVARLVLVNNSQDTRRLSATAYLDWVLGTTRGDAAPYIITEMDGTTGAMFARNPWNGDFSTRIAFADLAGKQVRWTADRTEFLGRNGTPARPAALVRREALSGRSGAALDPCCVLQQEVVLAPGERAEVVLLLGETETREQARELIARYRTADLDASLNAVTGQWDDILSTVQVKTPDRSLDLLLNGWLLYQTLACRVWGRTALYQSSGAYGFRDQLQDVMALMVSRSDLARAHLLKSAGRQFVEGDVQHWWHEPSGRGIRTRMTDDLLWLPYVVGHYLEVTADRGVLEERIPFLAGQVLADGQLESYFEPRVSEEEGTLYEHCARAIDRSLEVGQHGLPLMGTGDWNDGMNRVGAGGKGESVWLAWFLASVLKTWIPLARAQGESTRVQAWSQRLASLTEAVREAGWDGQWFRRAYFDDGTPLGSSTNDECRIDSIAQSWSVISGVADPAQARQAMASLDERLVRRKDAILLLLEPPFDDGPMEPGYIKGYLPGVRENGGQYTHAAAWAVIAFAMQGDGDKAAELLAILNPINHTATPAGVDRYQVEPYVLAGDVYAETPHIGRGGWTWYSGSAGWVYRAGLEWLLGFRLHADRLLLDPCIPAVWPTYSMTYRRGTTHYDIVVENPRGAGRGVTTLELDGVSLDVQDGVPLTDDHQRHQVRVVLG